MPETGQPRTRAGDEHRQYDWTPRPDPTVLTTEALMREIGALKSLLDQRLEGMDDLMDEKFAAVEKQFVLVERQRVEQKTDSEKAVAAALQAAKEAVQEQTIASEKSINKSEATTTKEIEALKATNATASEATRRDIDSLRERIAAGELKTSALAEQKAGAREVTSDMSVVRNTNIAAAQLGAQIRGLYVAFAGLMVSGVTVLLAAIATHGFR